MSEVFFSFNRLVFLSVDFCCSYQSCFNDFFSLVIKKRRRKRRKSPVRKAVRMMWRLGMKEYREPKPSRGTGVGEDAGAGVGNREHPRTSPHGDASHLESCAYSQRTIFILLS